MTLFKEFSHSHRTLPWLLKIRSSEIHQQTYHHAVVLLLSRFLQNTAKEFEVIQILFYHMDKIFPAGKGRHKMTDLKHKVTPTSKGPAPGKKQHPNQTINKQPPNRFIGALCNCRSYLVGHKNMPWGGTLQIPTLEVWICTPSLQRNCTSHNETQP